ncbi:endonuclease/exonuclease/phosphatase family protein [Kitasatospora terrestris]|uniref:Endonuclease/exonuclease/phosphatase family protein n=1 Tax=Kitasatospora terrestris TaxID=258051 RepID=A0ABP9EIQ6_9ACTN
MIKRLVTELRGVGLRRIGSRRIGLRRIGLRARTLRRVRAARAVPVAVAVLLLGHRLVPNTPWHLGSLLEALLPWLGLAVPVLLLGALLRRSRRLAAAALLPALAWTFAFGGRLLPGGDGAYDLTVVQHNVAAQNEDPRGTARALAATGADLVAVEELMDPATAVYEQELAAAYPYRARSGTVGLWSRHPLSEVRPVDLKPSGLQVYWKRGLRVVAHTPDGEVAVYVAHLPSVRFGGLGGFTSERRDESAGKLAAVLDAEPLQRVILAGDFNSTLDDRGLAPVTSRLTAARSGFDFSWPAAFPVARIDQILCRGLTPVRTWTLPATGSDHLPVAARIRVNGPSA